MRASSGLDAAMLAAGVLLALALLAGALLAGCTPTAQRTALDASAAAATSAAVVVDAETRAVRLEAAAVYERRVAVCAGEPACILRVRATVRALPRVQTSEALVSAQHRAAAAIEAGSRCAQSDRACQGTTAADAAAASADVARLLVQLRALPPLADTTTETTP